MCPFPEAKVIEAIADYLNDKHANHYIVYNISEYKYDNVYFNNSVNYFLFRSIIINIIFYRSLSMHFQESPLRP